LLESSDSISKHASSKQKEKLSELIVNEKLEETKEKLLKLIVNEKRINY
jgi:hypothetical protein